MGKRLNLGIIGLSDGNGHPYSWSAIINGYDAAAMASCPFPVIPGYLAKQRYPDDFIANAAVTHIWTQDAAISRHIAQCSRIPVVVRSVTDMMGAVDGVLLARDDVGTREELAGPFLAAGIPIFIDKPLALDVQTARQLFRSARTPDHLFTCSALRFAKEFRLDARQQAALGTIRRIEAFAPKSWAKYAVHAIEPMLLLMFDAGPVRATTSWCEGPRTALNLQWESGATAIVSTSGEEGTPIRLSVTGDHSSCDLRFADAFFAFRESLRSFLQVVRGEARSIPEHFVCQVVELLEFGCSARPRADAV